MSILSYLSRENRKERKLEKNIRRANNKHTPNDYRQIALQEVLDEAKAGNEMAVNGLIVRLAVNAEPSIEDEKEKDWICETLIDIGSRQLPQIKKAMRTSDAVNWIHRIMRQVVSEEEFTAELLSVLSDFDTEYERNPDRKIHTIASLEDVSGSKVVDAVVRCLDDVDETVRFQTVVTLATIGDEQSREPLLKTITEDESIRVRNEAIDAFARLEWSTTGFKKKIDDLLPAGYKHEKSGKIVKLRTAER